MEGKVSVARRRCANPKMEATTKGRSILLHEKKKKKIE